MKDPQRFSDLNTDSPFDGKFHLISTGARGTTPKPKDFPQKDGVAVKIITNSGWQLLRFSPAKYCHFKHIVRDEQSARDYAERVEQLVKRKHWHGKLVLVVVATPHATLFHDIDH